ncbi:glycosyltransferase family 9 protein [Pigmentiphaga soli]|uniref:Glycosyltransferase family 9 protein n=1 Tax=Pigmentiphaga soli TaxID=1007095 RepID=A0ABP8HN78_9BURK
MPRPPGSALVIALRYLGDVLLATPLARALRSRYPDCAVDMLVFSGTEGMLRNNPDLRDVITIAERGGRDATLAMLRRLWRRYDMALVPQPGDRPHLFALAAAPLRYGFVPAQAGQAWWKRLSLTRPLVAEPGSHRVQENERLARAAGLGPTGALVAPTAGLQPGDWPARLARSLPDGPPFDPARPYAVIHPYPRWRYKRWHVPGWQALIAGLEGDGLQLVLTGGPQADETAYADALLDSLPPGQRRAILRVQGRLDLAETADLLRHARLYVGPDTGTTHLAAACGAPTLALFGPTDPRAWGPTPASGLDRPWERAAPRQRRGNVILLQNSGRGCVPCQQEGCQRRRDSASDCLDSLDAGAVLAAARDLLGETAR